MKGSNIGEFGWLNVLVVAVAMLGFAREGFSQSPANDDFVNASMLSAGLPANASGPNVGATVEDGEYLFYTDAGASVWWRWQATASGWVVASTAGSSIDTLLVAFSGSELASLEVLDQNDDYGNSSQSRVRFEAQAGETYYLQATGFSAVEGSIAISIVEGVAPTPPVLNSISFDTYDVDVSGGAAPLTITIDLTTPDEWQEVNVDFYDENGDYVVGAPFYFFQRTDGGDVMDQTGGVYQGQLEIPGFRESEIWTVEVYMRESNDDEAFYASSGLAFPAPFPGEISITNTGVVDSGPPVVSALTFIPNTVDVSDSSQQVTVRVAAQDDQGIDWLRFEIYDADENYFGPNDPFFSMQLVSGDAKNGVYEGTFTVSTMVSPGEWKPLVSLGDVAGRQSYYGDIFGDDPLPAGSDHFLTVVNNSAVNQAPVLHSLTATPDTVNLSDPAPPPVVLRVEASDDFGIGNGSVTVTVTLDDGEHYYGMNRVSGDNLSGVWEKTLAIPLGTAAGTYPIGVSIGDTSDVFVYYGLGNDPLPAGSTQFLTVIDSPAVSAYDAWIALHPEVPVGMRGVADDPDADGLANGVEFYLGLLPMVDSRSVVSDPNAGNLLRLLERGGEVGMAVTVSLENLALGDYPGIDGLAQISTDGKTWQNVGMDELADGLWEVLRPLPVGGRLLFRFAVRQGP